MSKQSNREAERLRNQGLLSSNAVNKLVENVGVQQLKYWTSNRWVNEAPESRERRLRSTSLKFYYTQDEVYKIQYMDFMVNKLGWSPKIASRILDEILAESRIEQGRIWGQYKGAVFGLPTLERVA